MDPENQGLPCGRRLKPIDEALESLSSPEERFTTYVVKENDDEFNPEI